MRLIDRTVHINASPTYAQCSHTLELLPSTFRPVWYQLETSLLKASSQLISMVEIPVRANMILWSWFGSRIIPDINASALRPAYATVGA